MAQKSSLFPEIENNLFYFESDHEALKGNEDYSEVLKAIVVLSAQREQLIKDHKRVLEIRKKVLEDPERVLEKVQNKEDLGFELPPTFETYKVPVINFDKYGVEIPESVLREIYPDSDHEIKIEEDLRRKKNNRREWTIEEQKKLEELLQTYPPEPIERQRHLKIAKALGDRTLAQVQSRIQKYFKKLHKAGLPIPGRVPKSIGRSNRKALHKHQRYNEHLWKPTTFFPEYTVPVVMDDSDCVPGPTSCEPPPPLQSTSSNHLLRTDCHQASSSNHCRSDREMKMELLNRVRAEKLREKEDTSPPIRHTWFKCYRCGESPIVGARWHCVICPKSVDYCTDCTMAQLNDRNPHPLDHFLTVILNEAWDHGKMPAPSENEMKLELLKRVEAERVREKADTRPPVKHMWFKCYRCGEQPIVGARWHCVTCPKSVDYCTNCTVAQLNEKNPHPLDHYLAIVHNGTEGHGEGSNSSDKQRKLELLKRVGAVKVKEKEDARPAFVHLGFRCDRCCEEPIVGTRWHCNTCPQSVDYCTECAVLQMFDRIPHPVDHFLATIYNETESPSGSAATSEQSESDSSDSDESECGDSSNLEDLVKTEPETFSGYNSSLAEKENGYQSNLEAFVKTEPQSFEDSMDVASE